MCQLDASLAASGATALLMTHAQVVEMINRLAPMTSKQQKEHNSRAAAVASTMSTADDNTLDGIFAAMQPSAPMAMSAALKASAGLQDPLLQQPPTSAATDGELQQHAAAARLLLSILQWYVHLRLCAWHWIKACHDYGLYGAPFKDSPTSSKQQPAFVLLEFAVLSLTCGVCMLLCLSSTSIAINYALGCGAVVWRVVRGPCGYQCIKQPH